MIERCVQKLLNADFLSYEISPPKAPSIGEGLLKELQGWDQFDALVCTDAPLAKFKQSAILTSLKLQNALQKPVICTLNMRDRNTIALQGDILGANELDIRLFLTLTGDPIKLGDRPSAKGVFEGNSLLLAELIHSFNQNKDLDGYPIKGQIKPIYPFGVINSYSNNPLSLKNKMRRKIASGMLALFTQPVYDTEVAKLILQWCAEINQELGSHAQVVFGYFPILRYKTAHFLYSKLPGVFVPKIWLDELEKAQKLGEKEEEKVGFALSQKLFEDIKNIHNKIHFMNSNKIALAKQILQ
ncbi:5,10-methylenetetrahydrofolate reductase [Helicobacter sp. 12S02634-8]|uniref:methylenetetrahydrofolate reductase n=1 Tax=Helicobacter sp. 12S02634-8 TaxID=1476199 RepID=UPI000BA6FA79|nr:methylenetetrahydrofolate reductase [Helicobacter sp. 12S02634-8]PAF46935.1 5,10-methylenetetrahydrofolate reductase [Helicobacter sp. 12S02634-8]